jgi:hypothetical protein
VGGDGAADPGAGELVVNLGDGLVQLGGVGAGGVGVVAADLDLGAQGQPELLRLIRGRAGWLRVVVQVPALAALLRAQVTGTLSAGRAGGL